MPESTPTAVGGSPERGVADLGAPAVDPLPAWTRTDTLRTAAAGLVLVVLGALAVHLHGRPGQGSDAALSLVVGAALGIVFERGRFCFFCITRDVAERRDTSGLLAILAALATGAVGYAVVLGLFVPNAGAGVLPPQAHIGPVSPALAIAAFVFGLGIVISHGCIGGHLYRLGEGSIRSAVALVGALVGFGLGFATWNTLYLRVVTEGAEPLWLPEHLGYTGSLVLTLVVLGAGGLLVLRWVPRRPARPAERVDVGLVRDAVLRRRWPVLVTGSLVGLIGALAYLRVGPLGVTAQLGSVSRSVLDDADLLPTTLYGLDTFAGCATVVLETILPNGWLVIGIVVASFAAALASGRFGLERVGAGGSVAALLGGVLLGWGAMTALGCTFGVLLSGTQAFAVSGWVFGLFLAAGLAVAYRLRLQDL